MNFTDYIEGISFRFYKPHIRPIGFQKLSNILGRVDISLETLNTKLPVDKKTMRKRLHALEEIPRMSTFAIGAMINKGVSLMPNDACFVNVGVWNGFSLLAGMMENQQKKCIGIDNFSQFGAPREQFLGQFNRYKSHNHYFYNMDFHDYFSNIHSGPIGFYMYDGEHSYENQLEGLRVAEPFFSKNCIILIDDTNFEAPRQANLDFIAKSEYKYHILYDKTTYANCHPTLWNGVMIFQRIS